MTMVLTWLHILAAVSWIGGMIFLSLVVVPVIRRPPLAQQRAVLFPIVARRFRLVAWGAMLLLLATGPILASARGISLINPTTWPSIFAIKLTLVGLLFVLTAAHDLALGPRVAEMMKRPEQERSASDLLLLRWSPWVARSSLLLALAVLFSAVSLARS
ncbi:MAG TPA: DUF4149 domain-containing protein [Nitrospiraceae bacterium]|nr:DUF4149 domain-containing protein [Nitrospiraceae bacterium]